MPSGVQRGIRDGVPQPLQKLQQSQWKQLQQHLQQHLRPQQQIPQETEEEDGGAGEELDQGEAEPVEQEETVCQEHPGNQQQQGEESAAHLHTEEALSKQLHLETRSLSGTEFNIIIQKYHISQGYLHKSALESASVTCLKMAKITRT